MGRQGDNSYHHPWVSRDYEEIDCRATGCFFNKELKCSVPSLCKIDDTGKCVGFKAKQQTTIVDGD